MKNKTKLKIIKWVEKILKYKHPPIKTNFNEEKFQVKVLKFEKEYDTYTFSRFIQEDARYFIASKFVKILNKSDALVIKTEQQPLNGKRKVTAKMYYLVQRSNPSKSSNSNK